MSKFNSKSVGTKTTNLADGKAYMMDSRMELVHAVVSSFLENKFYESGDGRAIRIAELVTKCEPIFVAKLAVVARTEFLVRSTPIVLLGELAKTHRGDSLVMKAIEKTVQRVDDMTELVAYLKGSLPKQVKRGLRHAILKFKPYQLAKYKGEGKDVKLVDLFNLVHPNPKFATTEQKDAWEALMKGKLKSTDTWEAVISASKDKKRDWEALVAEDKLGYMALIRNLNNLIRYGVSDKTLKTAVRKLTSRIEVKKSKQLPFRFITAWENVKGNRTLTDAIAKAMELAVSNTPKFKGNTLIAIDSSGSMDSGHGSTLRKAAIFGATLFKANKTADMVLFHTAIKEITISTITPITDMVEKIENAAGGGGTQTSLVFDYGVYKKKKYDRIIILSDNESWAERMYGESIKAHYANYKSETGADPFVYAVDLAGYGTKDVTGTKVFHMAGWSDRLLDFMSAVEEGDSLVKYIESIEL